MFGGVINCYMECILEDLIPGSGRPLEKEMATHSRTLAWKIPWTRGASRATVHGVAKSLD